MVIIPTNIDQLSLHDLRNHFRGGLPERDASRYANLESRVPLDLISSAADFAFLGKSTTNKNAVAFLKQLSLLSGAKDDGHIADYQPELVEIQRSGGLERSRQAIFLKPVKASIKSDDQFDPQSPLIIWDSGSEISIVRPSLVKQEGYLITTIHKGLSDLTTTEEQLITFISLKDESQLLFGTRYTSKNETASTVIKAVKEKMKSL